MHSPPINEDAMIPLTKSMKDLGEINRLQARTMRRMYRDMRHMFDNLPEELQEWWGKRLEVWKSICWDSAQYRDELHLACRNLEVENNRLKTILKANNLEELPF